MPKPSKTVQAACHLLRSRVRLHGARISLTGAAFADDTDQVRAALKTHTESWVVPLINAIERGDLGTLAQLVKNNQPAADSIEKEPV